MAYLLVCGHGHAQNLVPNPSFETYTECPVGPVFGICGVTIVPPWQCGTAGTSDYYHVCAVEPEAGVPYNTFGNQYPHTGQGYVGSYYKNNNGNWREYIQVQLTEPLIAGYNYEVNFYVSLADQSCGIENIGVYFSENAPTSSSSGPLNVIPQVEANLGFIQDTQHWVLISGCYPAMGGEEWITIGNFYDNAQTIINPDCIPFVTTVYYYLDDVSVIQAELTEPIVFDLGGAFNVCDPYLIDPDIPDAEYLWSDGSTDPTLLVTESGMYHVTVSVDCNRGIDSVEIIFIGTPEAVEIGPEEITICNGENYTISLDPDLGDYLWQDGSTDPVYVITTPGIYQVSLDDGCDVTTDEITVFVMDAPAPFTLGEDTPMCVNDEIEYFFDPALGDFLWQDNSTLPEYTIMESGSYALTISNMCGSVSDQINVSDLDAPLPFSLGPDTALCIGEEIFIVFDPALGEFEWQDNSDESNFLITEEGTYALTITNICGFASDEFVVTPLFPQVLDLGVEQLMLCAGEQIDLQLDPSFGPYVWQDSSVTSLYTISGPGLYSATVTSTCGMVSDTVEVIGITVPDFQLPPDQAICPGNSILLDGSGIAGNYFWQDSSTTLTYQVDQPGTYSLMITNQCGTSIDSIIFVEQPPLASPNLGPDLNLCTGEQIILYANFPNVNYLWQDMSTADSLVITGPGLYVLQIDDMCTTAVDSVLITSNNIPPELNLPAVLNLCQTDTIILDAGITGVQYQWSGGSQASAITISSPGAYSLTVSNACGSDADTVLIADAGAYPFVSLGPDFSLCPLTDSLLSPLATDVQSWLWQDGSDDDSFEVTNDGTISVEVSNICGVYLDTLIVTALPPVPVFDLGPDTSICPGELITFTINISGVNILWPDGSTDSDFSVAGDEEVYLTVSNLCGSSTDSVVVNTLPAPPVLEIGIDQSLCPGDSIIISSGLSGVDYLWQDGSTGPAYTATDASLVILSVTNECGASTDTLEITISTEGPQVELGDDVFGCQGEIITLMADVLGVNYLWQDGSTQPTLTVATAGTYILQVNNSCGIGSDTIVVDLSGQIPAPSLGPDTVLCENVLYQLQSEAAQGTIVEWQDGSSNNSFTVSQPGTYVLSEANQCGEKADTIDIAYTALPGIFELGPDTILCPGEFLFLSAPLTTSLITWQDGSHGLTMVADQAIQYSLLLSNQCGETKDELTLSFDDQVPSIDIDEKIPYCKGDIITLDATQPFSASYAWSTGSNLPVLYVSTPGIYAVNVSTPCQSAQQDIIVIEDDHCSDGIYIPNAFSPNDDQVNDLFSISIGPEVNVVSLNCEIYDRWGNQVFNSQDPLFTWDGFFRGSTLMPGVYVYLITAEYEVRGALHHIILSGDVTLIR